MCAPATLFDLDVIDQPARAEPLPPSLHAATLADVGRLYERLRAAGASGCDLARLAKEVETSTTRRQFRALTVLGCTVTVHL